MNTYRAVVLGPTGAVGKELVRELISSSRCAKVTAFARRPPQNTDLANVAKLEWRVVDFDNSVANILNEANASGAPPTAVFCALGTTLKKAGSAADFVRIDRDLVLSLARTFKQSGVPNFSIVSSMGANADSWFLYPRTKGEIEAGLQQIGFTRLAIFRPSLLEGEREEHRFGESVANTIAPYLNPLLVGSWLRKYRSIHVATVAKAMVRDFEASLDEQQAAESPLRNLAKHGNVVMYESDAIADLGTADTA